MSENDRCDDRRSDYQLRYRTARRVRLCSIARRARKNHTKIKRTSEGQREREKRRASSQVAKLVALDFSLRQIIRLARARAVLAFRELAFLRRRAGVNYCSARATRQRDARVRDFYDRARGLCARVPRRFIYLRYERRALYCCAAAHVTPGDVDPSTFVQDSSFYVSDWRRPFSRRLIINYVHLNIEFVYRRRETGTTLATVGGTAVVKSPRGQYIYALRSRAQGADGGRHDAAARGLGSFPFTVSDATGTRPR